MLDEFIQNIAELLYQQYIVYEKYLAYVPYFIGAFAATVLLTPLIGYIATKLKVFDLPAGERKAKQNKFDDPQRHIHKRKVPFLGGLAVLIPLILYLLFTVNGHPLLIPILLGVLILTISGALDDVFNLPANIQFVAQAAAAIIIAVSIIDFRFINNPLGGYIYLDQFVKEFSILGIPQRLVLPGDFLLFWWILVCINALKWVCGSDGIFEGNSALAFLFLFFIGVRTNSPEVVMLSILMTGGIAGFLIYNYPPAKIHTGGSGKTVYGFLISVLSVVNGAKVATTMIILTLPLADFIFVIINRYLKYKPKNFLELMRINDRTHFHHQLLAMGLSMKKVFLIEISITLLVGSLAVLTAGTTKLFVLLASAFLGTIFLFIVHHFRKKHEEKARTKKESATPESRYSY